MSGRRPLVVRGSNEPPAWAPSSEAGNDYAFDFIPIDTARIRIEILDQAVANAVLAVATDDDPAVALPAARGSEEGLVTIRIGDRDAVLGRVPRGYEVYYSLATSRRVLEIPLEAWSTPNGPVIDLAMGRTPHYGNYSIGTLTTNRLRLRPLTASDTPALLSYRGDADVCRYLPFQPMDAAEIARRLETQWNRFTLDEDGQGITLGVQRRDTGELIGDVVLFLRSREQGVGEVGWVFSPSVAGQGFATEAASCLMSQGFRAFGMRRIIARLDERNSASARLCERLGMRLESRLVENEMFKGELTTELDYAILQKEWRYPARRASNESRD